MFGWFRKKRSLEEAVFEHKAVVIHGVPFTLKKINTLNFLEGSRVMIQAYDTYKMKSAEPSQAFESGKKIQDHYRDVIMAGVVSPRLTRKREENGFYVDDILENSGLSMAIYQAIIEFTYGKKKLNARFPKNA